jgi:Alternative complex III, ActD subunit
MRRRRMDIKYDDRFGLYGLMAEFATAEELVEATKNAYAAGYRKMDAYAPMPVEGLPQALGTTSTLVSMLVFLAGICGCCFGFGLMWWITVIAYPHNVAGRALYSWPAYIPPTFEMTVLFASLTAVIGMLILNGLPQPYHPVFNVPRFQLASQSRFFLCIEAHDPRFSLPETKAFLEGLNPYEVSEVAK